MYLLHSRQQKQLDSLWLPALTLEQQNIWMLNCSATFGVLTSLICKRSIWNTTTVTYCPQSHHNMVYGDWKVFAYLDHIEHLSELHPGARYASCYWLQLLFPPTLVQCEIQPVFGPLPLSAKLTDAMSMVPVPSINVIVFSDHWLELMPEVPQCMMQLHCFSP